MLIFMRIVHTYMILFQCADPCKKSEQHRRVYCISNLGKRAASKMCGNETAPETTRACPTSDCPYHWVPGPWSTVRLFV